MNIFAHIMINYVALSFIIPETQKYLIPIAIFSVIPDLDHLPGYVKLRFNLRKLSKIRPEEHINHFRTAMQEPAGILIGILVLLILYLFGIDETYLIIVAICLALHWLVDFLTVDTRPLYPFSNKRVNFFFHTRKQRLVREAVITPIALILFLLAYF
ncbi:metal-dependent hydrolase [Candidatus Woesearchaeota archaeon]|nr:metal-dependent hydrolase [Candidatus Woesearchaeota archaeon]